MGTVYSMVDEVVKVDKLWRQTRTVEWDYKKQSQPWAGNGKEMYVLSHLNSNSRLTINFHMTFGE